MERHMAYVLLIARNQRNIAGKYYTDQHHKNRINNLPIRYLNVLDKGYYQKSPYYETKALPDFLIRYTYAKHTEPKM